MKISFRPFFIATVSRIHIMSHNHRHRHRHHHRYYHALSHVAVHDFMLFLNAIHNLPIP